MLIVITALIKIIVVIVIVVFVVFVIVLQDKLQVLFMQSDGGLTPMKRLVAKKLSRNNILPPLANYENPVYISKTKMLFWGVFF